MSVRQIDITFGDVVYYPARRALESDGYNPDVEEVVEYNRVSYIRECIHEGHPVREMNRQAGDGFLARWRCCLCKEECDEPPKTGGVFLHEGWRWMTKARAAAEALR